ncbi:hypothetical protein [Flagellimonas sp. SN16]|uniref:hypothetical protein n=1 Tax=Flagellimonas sp. SN16 TaxID=3415142 RepID=UPI003C574D4D
MTINIILIGISRFTYIVVDKFFDSEGPYLGFRWLSTAFWNTGVEIFTINIGFLMYYGTLFMEKEVVKMFRRVAFFLVAIGFFFLSWILFDDTGITNTLEIYFSIATGLFSAKIAMEMYKFILAYLKGLKVSVRELIQVIALNIPEKYLDTKSIEVYQEEVVWPTLKKVSDEF